MAGGPVLDEEERQGYSLVCSFLFRQLYSLSSLFFFFFAALFVRLLEASEPLLPVCSFVI